MVMELRKFATRSAPSSGSRRASSAGSCVGDTDRTFPGLAVVAVSGGYAHLPLEIGLRNVTIAVQSDQRPNPDGDRVCAEGEGPLPCRPRCGYRRRRRG